MRTLCAWCGEREKVGGRWGPVRLPLPAKGEPVSHGICPACEREFEADVTKNPSASSAIVNVFGEYANRLTGEQKEALLSDIRALASELADDYSQELDYYDAAVELRKRIGGRDVLPLYVQSLVAGRRRGKNPGVPHGTFAKLRREAVRRGASDPDAYAAAVERKMKGNPRWVPESESQALSEAILGLRVVEQKFLTGDEPRAIAALNEVTTILATLAQRAREGIHKNPTLAILGNPGRRKLARKVLAIDYVHASDGKKYTHDFTEDSDHGPVCAYVEDGGKRVVFEAADGRAIVKDY